MSTENSESDDRQTQAINAVAWEVEQLRQEASMATAILGDIYELLKQALKQEKP